MVKYVEWIETFINDGKISIHYDNRLGDWFENQPKGSRLHTFDFKEVRNGKFHDHFPATEMVLTVIWEFDEISDYDEYKKWFAILDNAKKIYPDIVEA